ncbi:MAG: SLC13 family permease [Phycisphaeraceae bacterium]
MTWESWVMLGLLAMMAITILRGVAGADTVLLGGLSLAMGIGALSEALGLNSADARFPGTVEAVAGFGSKAVVTIGVLFVIAEGLRQTGAMAMVTRPLLGQPKTLAVAQTRLMLPVAGLSAFLNNTPIVAMLMPIVTDWCRRTGISPSKLFIPLSYAAIMGGSCSLIGTATNVFVAAEYGAALDAGQVKGAPLAMFSITYVGLPAALVGIGYILLTSRWLLPNHGDASDNRDARQYTFEMLVDPDSPIDGKSIEEAGLRNLPGGYLIGIERDGERRVAVAPQTTLHRGDVLIFAGELDSMLELTETKGLSRATRDQAQKLPPNLELIEAVLSDRSPLVGKSVREGGFRSVYNAVVIAVHRGGERLDAKIGEIVLRAGDTLLLEADRQFVTRHRNRQDFYYLNALGAAERYRSNKAAIALVVLAAVVALATTQVMDLVTAALLGAGVMVVTGCCSTYEARQSINWRVLIMMGSAIGFGQAMYTTGVATEAATALIGLMPDGQPIYSLAAVYLVAMVLTSIIGPVPTAGLLFPVLIAVAGPGGLDCDFTPFAVTLMMTAAASFASPSAYQTNLMVANAGGYRPIDFLRMGLPLNLLVMATTLLITPRVWPFY